MAWLVQSYYVEIQEVSYNKTTDQLQQIKSQINIQDNII